MKTYFPAFVCMLCLFGICIVSLSIGLQLFNPLLGMLALVVLAFLLVYTAGLVEG